MSWRRASWALFAGVSLAASWLVADSGPGQRLEFAFADGSASALRQPVASDVVIVAIDARSLAEIGQWPWPRRLHAELLERIGPAAPARLFVDIDFSTHSTPTDDAALANALANWRGHPVVLPAFLQRLSASGTDLVLTQPLPEFRARAALGSVNLLPAADGLVRDMPAAAGDVPPVAAVLHRTDGDGSGWIDYTIDPSSFLTVSFSDVVANRVPAEYLADKIVFVGATAIELGDMIPVPLYQSLPGAVVQALAYETLRHGAHRPLPGAITWTIAAAWALALAFVCRRSGWRRDALVTSLAVAVLPALALGARAALDLVVPVLPFAAVAAVVLALSTLRSLEIETVRALMYSIGLRRRGALLRSIVESSTDCIVCIDSAGVVRTANPAATALFRIERELLIDRSLLHFVPGLLTDADGNARSLAAISNSILETAARTADGDDFPVELSVSRVRLDNESLYTAIVRDVSERHAQQRQLQFQATHDALTALPNRPALAAQLDAHLKGSRPASRVGLLMIDLNRFKEVNDTLGHNVGDYVLHEAARRLHDVANDAGFIARIGGDEFALVVADYTDRNEIIRLSQDLVACLRTPVDTCGVSIDIGLSIGIALYPEDSSNAEELFRHSDVAMYLAKRRNTGFEFYDPANDPHSVRRLEIASRLRRAIPADELEMHYQPQVNLRSGDVTSVEALVRWRDPVLGNVRPDEFIMLAETTDLIQPLSAWTMQQAFVQSVRWREEGLDLCIAVNVSARLLQDAGLPARVAALLAETGADPARIELEVTESAMMLDPQRALEVTESLSELGVQISIDDYGTGYSSLAYLRDLPAHALKLDKSFVTNLQQSDGDRIIAASTVQMAHALNLAVVAEGVETPGVADLLRELGYDFAQGYLYSAALPPVELAAWVKRFRDPGPRQAVSAAR